MTVAPVNEDPEISLRPVAPEDEAFLQTAYASGREIEMAQVAWNDEQKSAFLSMQFSAQQRHYKSRYPDALHQIILENGSPVGRVYVDRGIDEIRILDFTILAAHRNRGIGTMLLRDLIGEAESASLPLSIYVEVFNPSQRLFERLGFSQSSNDGVNILFEWRPAA